MKTWIIRVLVVAFLAAGVASCDGGKDDHKGHNHKAGEKH